MIAAQSRAELERWTLLNKWGKRRREALRECLKDFVFVSADEIVCLHWAESKYNARRIGHPISCEDAWIAATALAYDAPLVTHNLDDFLNVPNLISLQRNKLNQASAKSVSLIHYLEIIIWLPTQDISENERRNDRSV